MLDQDLSFTAGIEGDLGTLCLFLGKRSFLVDGFIYWSNSAGKSIPGLQDQLELKAQVVQRMGLCLD